MTLEEMVDDLDDRLEAVEIVLNTVAQATAKCTSVAKQNRALIEKLFVAVKELAHGRMIDVNLEPRKN